MQQNCIIVITVICKASLYSGREGVESLAYLLVMHSDQNIKLQNNLQIYILKKNYGSHIYYQLVRNFRRCPTRLTSGPLPFYFRFGPPTPGAGAFEPIIARIISTGQSPLLSYHKQNFQITIQSFQGVMGGILVFWWVQLKKSSKNIKNCLSPRGIVPMTYPPAFARCIPRWPLHPTTELRMALLPMRFFYCTLFSRFLSMYFYNILQY